MSRAEIVAIVRADYFDERFSEIQKQLDLQLRSTAPLRCSWRSRTSVSESRTPQDGWGSACVSAVLLRGPALKRPTKGGGDMDFRIA